MIQFLPRPLASGQRDNEKTCLVREEINKREQKKGLYRNREAGFLADVGVWGLGFSLHGVTCMQLCLPSRSPPEFTWEAEPMKAAG